MNVSAKPKEHYIDNVKFTQAATEYSRLYNECVAAGLPKPKLSNYCGECIILLANKISNMNCFNGYSFKDEMISDGIEVVLRYFHKFNPEAISKKTGKKTAGAHAYFTMFIYNAMRNRIKIEKLEMFIRQKYIAQCEDIFIELQEHDAANFNEELKDILKEMSGDEYLEYDEKNKIKADKATNNNIVLKTVVDKKEIEDHKEIVDIFYPESDLDFFVDSENEALIW